MIDSYLKEKMMTWEQDEVVRLLSSKPGTQYQESDEQGREAIRHWVKDLLHTTEVKVTFAKADGTIRTMRCTLDPLKLPPQSAPIIITNETRRRKEPDSESVRVFDLDKQEWRSFRFDRLRNITAELNLV